LEALHSRHPKHPAGFHYLIHAYDNPVLAPRAENVARGYSDIAPNVPHALHMPAHIFVRLGLWQDVIDWNTRSAQAALEQPVNGAVSKHYVHAIDYLVYGYLQQSQDQLAHEALAEMLSQGRFQPGFVTAYGLAAAQARYALERERWDDAAALQSRVPATFDWDKYPAVVAISEFSRGIGAARSGKLDVASDAIEQLDALHQQLVDSGDRYWSVLVDSQRHSVRAWLAYAQGEQQQAVDQMRVAADLEDSIDKHPVTPGSVLPARELLGDMLLSMGQHAEALAAYDSALAISPNRLRSQHGVRQATDAQRLSANAMTR
jgi:tetratricopeptide (TPR) repeat protein